MSIPHEGPVDRPRIEAAYDKLCKQLLAMQNSEGFWTGKLSNSALSTATAVSALSVQQAAIPKLAAESQPLIDRGCDYLRASQNPDGGFGDTDKSYSNIATTYLALAAWELAGHSQKYSAERNKAWQYVERVGAWNGLKKRYGKDKTFVVRS